MKYSGLVALLISRLIAVVIGNETTRVLSCSSSTVTVAGSLQVGDILVQADNHHKDLDDLCRNECNVLFRQVVEDRGNGVYETQKATFSQVFPEDTYDALNAHVAVESVLPVCDNDDNNNQPTSSSSKAMIRRKLQEAPSDMPSDVPSMVPSLSPDALGRGKDYYDDYYSKDGSKDYDDHYYSDDYKGGSDDACRLFIDATKKFIFDMYCLIRNLDCTEYNPGQDDDKQPYDDYYTSGSKDHRRRLQETSDSLFANRKTRPRRMKGVKGSSNNNRNHQMNRISNNNNNGLRKLQDKEAGAADAGATDAPPGTTTTINWNYEEPEPEVQDAQGQGQGGGTKNVQGEGGKHDDYYYDDHYYDDHYYDDHYVDDRIKHDDVYDDDDFFDDDDAYDQSGNKFWQVLDIVFSYIESIICIFKGCPDKVDDDYHKNDDKYYGDDDRYDDYYSKDQHVTGSIAGRRSLLSHIIEDTYAESYWISSLLRGGGEAEEEDTTMPHSTHDWMTLKQDGNCAFTKCTNVDAPRQCFHGHELMGDSCRDSLGRWFPTNSAWEFHSACVNQDYCYASNVFEQTLCDEQFYKSLLNSCASSHASGLVVLAQNVGVSKEDLYEHCSLVSVLLFSQVQLQRDVVHQQAQTFQSRFEQGGCRRQ